MTTVYVTRSQQMAAEALVERAARFGRPIEPWIVRIAEAADQSQPSARATDPAAVTTA